MASSDISDIVIVLTTAPDATRAEAIARALVEEHLAACVNVHGPMVSFYRWKGALERDEERQLVIKTSRDQLAALQARMVELHPYELPELLILPATGSEAYQTWVRETTRQD